MCQQDTRTSAELIGKDGQEFGTTSGRKDGLYCGRKD